LQVHRTRRDLPVSDFARPGAGDITQERQGMAYRFLLEVPETLAEDANVVINAVDDAQVILARNSHGLGFDDPYTDFTVAAHSLRVIDSVYGWYDDLGGNIPGSRVTMRVVLHSGERLSMHDLPRAQMIAAIRRDQPWVERSIPKIGEHETKVSPGSSVIETAVVPDEPEDAEFSGDTSLATRVRPVTIIAADEARASEGLTVSGVPHVLLRVYDIAAPERVYGELFGAELVGRGNRKPGGGWTFLPPVYDIEQEAQAGIEPDVAFLQNGPLSIALQREGRGYPLDYANVPHPIRLTVDTPSLNRIRGLVLMRSYNVIDSRPDAFSFRDPFGYTWALLGSADEER
jgi:hypothetical protein